MANDDSFLGTLAAVDPADWGAMGAGLLSAPTWQQGLAAGMQGVKAGRTERAAATRQAELDRMKKAEFEQQQEKGELEIQQMQDEIDIGNFVKLGPNSLYNTKTKETVYADPAMVAKLKTAGAGPTKVEYQAREPVMADGVYWTQSFDKANNVYTWTASDGRTKVGGPPTGAMPVSKSLQGMLPKMYLKKYEAMGEDATIAFQTQQNADRALGLLADPNVWTGFGEETIMDVKSAMITLGLATDEQIASVAGMEELRQISLDFVMANVSKTKGAVSDREMAIFQAASPNLRNTKAGNERILKAAKAIAIRQQEMYQFFNERVPTGQMKYWEAEEAWNKYVKANPIFLDENGKYDPEYFQTMPGGAEAVPAVPAQPAMPGQRVPSTEDLLNKYAPQ